MDPLSIPTACISLLGGIGLASKNIAGLVVIAREARRGVDGFSRELTSLGLCIETLQDDDDFALPETLQNQLLQLLKDCDAVVQKVNLLLLKHIHPNIERRLKWTVSTQDEVSGFQKRLEAYRATLDIALECANLTINPVVNDDTPVTKAEIAALRVEVQRFQTREREQNYLLNRFLDDTLAYTESMIDPADLAQETSIKQGKAKSPPEPQLLGNTAVEMQRAGPSSVNMDIPPRVDPPQYSTLFRSNVATDAGPSRSYVSGENASDYSNQGAEHETFNGQRLVKVDAKVLGMARVARASLGGKEANKLDLRLWRLLGVGLVADDTVIEAIRILLSQGAQFGPTNTIKSNQIQNMHLAGVSECIRYGAQFEKTILLDYMQDCWRYSPRNMYSVVEFLLEQGASVNGEFYKHLFTGPYPTGPMDETTTCTYAIGSPLHMAACLGKWSNLIPLFAEFGADIESLNQGLETPLDVAIRCINIEGIQKLVQLGASKKDITPGEVMIETVRTNLLDAIRKFPAVFVRLAERRGFKPNIQTLKKPHMHSYSGACKKCDEARFEANQALFRSCEKDVLQALGYVDSLNNGWVNEKATSSRKASSS